MLKKCLTCQTTQLKPPLTHWIEEKPSFVGDQKCYQGALKTEADYQKHYQGSVYYCSIICMEKQLDKEEEEGWAKGSCIICKDPLVVFNDTCFSRKHQREMKYLAITTPECLKKGTSHE